MSFPKLITPSPISKQWSQAVDLDRVPQAVLVSGKTGSELLLLALHMIGYLQCTNKQALEDSTQMCGECSSCRSHSKLAHPDVHFTFPVVGTGATSADHLPLWRSEVLANPYIDHSQWLRVQTKDNKQGNINRDEVMRILHDVSLQRFSEGHKVVLIWGAEYLGDESNRLLKIIEEPPEKTLILLLTTRIEKILPTILSRCRVYRLSQAPTDKIAQLLQDRGTSSDHALSLAYYADGHIGKAIENLSNEVDDAHEPDLPTWLRQCFSGKGAQITQSAAKLAGRTREEQKQFLSNALRFVRELGVVLAGQPQALKLPPQDASVANKLATLLSWEQLTALDEELNHLLYAVERNANGKIAFTASSIRIHHILVNQNLTKVTLKHAS